VLLRRGASVEAVEQDLLPVNGIGFVMLILFLGLDLDFFSALFLFVLVEFNELEERVVEKLLLEVLLKVQQGHVEHAHVLVTPWIDLQLQPQLLRLIQSCSPDAATSPAV